MLGFSYLVCPAEVNESLPNGIMPADAVKELSFRKAEAVFHTHSKDIVLGADTVVSCDGEIFGKPHGEAEAAAMLRKLSGKTHEVYTGMTIMSSDQAVTEITVAEVTFLPLTEKDISDYVKTGEPLDKAGAYAVQGRGSALISSVNGDYFAVMGLSSSKTARLLASFGVEPDLN